MRRVLAVQRDAVDAVHGARQNPLSSVLRAGGLRRVLEVPPVLVAVRGTHSVLFVGRQFVSGLQIPVPAFFVAADTCTFYIYDVHVTQARSGVSRRVVFGLRRRNSKN